MSKTTRIYRLVDQITSETDKKFEPVARMADAIVKTILETGRCCQKDLYDMDFAYHDVLSLWHFANALAVIELKQHREKSSPLPTQEQRYA